MNLRKNLAYLVRHLREKHRLSVRNRHTDSEVWYMYISPLNLLAGLLAFVLILFIIVTTTVAYTPILDLVPGYPGSRSRTMLVENIMRLDSLERELHNMQVYSENIALIMAGKNPVTRNDMHTPDSASPHGGTTVAPVAEDSLLRSQMEMPSGAYSLDDPDAARKSLRSSMELHSPVKGVVAGEFDPTENRYGISLATTDNQQVMAVMDGTVISSGWAPEEGFVVYIQHGDNMVSVYRHNARLLKKAGERVSRGEIIGYTGDGRTAEGSKKLFEFELWHNGSPVDPRRYIVF